MKNNPFLRLTKFELMLWLSSVLIVSSSSIFSGTSGFLSLMSSVIGVTALIFVAKGDVLGQILTMIFALLYSIISLELHYYGEMITYLGMTAPTAAISIITWLKNPYKKGCREVKVAKLTTPIILIMLVTTLTITFIFYFILKYFNTSNLIVSTISVATSYLASYLVIFRSPYYALAYAANDIVLIILWIVATLNNISYLAMVLCFVMFFLNDLYGFYNWRTMVKRQSSKKTL